MTYLRTSYESVSALLRAVSEETLVPRLYSLIEYNEPDWSTTAYSSFVLDCLKIRQELLRLEGFVSSDVEYLVVNDSDESFSVNLSTPHGLIGLNIDLPKLLVASARVVSEFIQEDTAAFVLWELERSGIRDGQAVSKERQEIYADILATFRGEERE